LEDKGGVVLLAPGCASFDMFKSFEHRGQCFKEEVAKLAQKQKESQTHG
jgi:UDP-N-acetylmuramoylalanine--D-glutamate ligase